MWLPVAERVCYPGGRAMRGGVFLLGGVCLIGGFQQCFSEIANIAHLLEKTI